MPSSLPHPPNYTVPDPPFEYNTYAVNSVKINNLEWKNPPTKDEGVRSTPKQLLYQFSPAFSFDTSVTTADLHACHFASNRHPCMETASYLTILLHVRDKFTPLLGLS